MSIRLRVSRTEIEADQICADGRRHHYLTRVLRLTVGAEVELFDGEGQTRPASISSIDKQTVLLVATGPSARRSAAGFRLISLVPLIKGERMDWAVTKLTELGASEIVPVHTARTVVSVTGERAEKRRERFERLAEAAARQSGRAAQPIIHPIGTLKAALGIWGTTAGWLGAGPRLIFSPHPRGRGLRGLLASGDSKGLDLVVCLTGPEGGFTEHELEESEAHGFELSRLGSPVLRAETAAISAVAAVSALIGDLGCDSEFDKANTKPRQKPPQEA